MATKKTHSCIQGDSYAYDYSPKSGITLDSNWSGTWAIVDQLGTSRTTLSSGILGKCTDDLCFEMRISPSDTNGITIGSYYLIVEVTNTPANFNKEIVQDVFKITPQGI